MSPEFYKKWSHIIQDVEKHSIPVEFIKKITVKLEGRKQYTINVEKLIDKGLGYDEIEESINDTLTELKDRLISMEFILNIEHIAEAVQPETEKLLNKL
jgi:hypothetical protein